MDENAANAIPTSNAGPQREASGHFWGQVAQTAIISAVIAAAVVAILHLAYFQPRLEAAAAAVAARPPLAVVNVDEVLRQNINTGMDSAAAIRAAEAQFKELGDHGYIVINNNAVLAAPKTARLP